MPAKMKSTAATVVVTNFPMSWLVAKRVCRRSAKPKRRWRGCRTSVEDHAAKLGVRRPHVPRNDPDDAVPKPKDQRNFTDPESKIMKTSNKGFRPMRQRSSGCQRRPDHCLGRRHRSGQRLSSSGTDGRTDAGEPGCHRRSTGKHRLVHCRCGLLQRRERAESGSERTH